jgi:hypothetical protein
MHLYTNQLTCFETNNPAAKRWAERTAELLAGYCLDVHDCGSEECPFEEQIIDSAAWQLWRGGGDTPCWGKLDVHRLMNRIADGARTDEPLWNSAVLTLVSFYCFLVKHEHLSRGKARHVMDQLNPLWQRACSWTMAQLALSHEAHDGLPHGAPQAQAN